MKLKYQPSEQQQLVDIAFQLVLTLKDGFDHKRDWALKGSREDLAAWVADQLRQCGFPTKPIGASWGVLKDPNAEPAGPIDGFEIYMPRRDG